MSQILHMMPELTVACVLRTGAYRGRFYTGVWVSRLRQMVERHLSVPFRFICLSNINFEFDGVEVRELQHPEWKGWWSKIELFGPLLADAKRVLYLDLDSLITGSLDEIAALDAPLIFTPPHPVLVGEPKRNTSRVKYRYQTSVMSWAPPAGARIYDRFSTAVMQRLASDQDWIAEIEPNCPTMPVEWFRKLRQCYEGPPDGVKVILMMPEKNDEASKRYPWVNAIWKAADSDDRDLLGTESSLAHA